MTPTARSLAELRKRGAFPAVVERWNPHARIRQDLYGFLDIVALEPGRTGLLGVQACVTGDQSKRLAKIAQNGKAALWVACGNRIVVMGWSRRGARGKPKRWTLSETSISPGEARTDLPAALDLIDELRAALAELLDCAEADIPTYTHVTVAPAIERARAVLAKCQP